MISFGTMLTAGHMNDGMRAWKQNANGKTYFLYDGSQPVMEMSNTGSTLATNTFGPSGPLARTSNGRTLLYTTDVQGNVSQQINAATGAVVASYGFDVWGHSSVVTSDPTASSDPYSGFGGMEGYFTDWETGLELCGLRYYDSGTGRWLNRDPVSYAGGVNLYEYCDNGPVGMSDVSGMWSFCGISGKDVGWGCFFSLMKALGNMIGSQCIAGAICSLSAGCIAGILSYAIVAAIVGLFPEGAVAPGVVSCIQAAIASVLTSLINMICNYIHCKIKPDPCAIYFSIAAAIISCIAGLLGASAENWQEWVINALTQFDLGSGGSDVCKYAKSFS